MTCSPSQMEEISSSNLNRLPEEIVQDIIAYLPLEDAVRTNVLSRLWRSRWKPYIVRLNFEGDPFLRSDTRSQDVTQAITAFLASDERSLKLCSGDDDGLIAWASKVAREELELHLSFPTHAASAKEVFKLVIMEPLARHLTPNFLANLKVLRIKSITNLSKDIVRGLLCSCSCLQSLSIAKCSDMKSLDIQANDHLRSFEMLDCPDITNILISAKNLELFRYRGHMPGLVQIQNAGFLVNVVLEFPKGLRQDSMFDCEAAISLLEDIKSVKSLIISGWFIEWLCAAGVIFKRLGFQFDSLLELRLIYNCQSVDEEGMNFIDCFLKIAPALLSFSVENDPTYGLVTRPTFRHSWHGPH